MISIDLILGAPVIDPQGNSAPRMSPNPVPFSKCPVTVEVIWKRLG